MPLDSGLKLEDKAVELCSKMKINNKKYRYITLKLNDEKTQVMVDKVVEKGDHPDQKVAYEELLTEMGQADGRFIIVDLTVNKANGSISDQLYCIMWNPDGSGAKTKMLYASAFGCVLTTLKIEGLTVQVQANDMDEMSYDLLMKLGKK